MAYLDRGMDGANKCKALIDGKIVEYDEAIDGHLSPSDRLQNNSIFLGVGVIYSVNETKQNFTTKDKFYKRRKAINPEGQPSPYSSP